MNPLEDAIGKALQFDAFEEAQKITGKSYKDDKETDALGTVLFFEHNADRQALLEVNGDTTLHNKLDRYLGICDDLGFKIVHTVPFDCHGRAEKQFFLCKPGVLMMIESYNVLDVNGSNIHYNWKPDGGYEAFCVLRKEGIRITSSGIWKEGDIWVGGHDVREALRYKMKLLETHGSFVCPWLYRESFSLCHYGDWDDVEPIKKEKGWQAASEIIDQRSDERLLQLPQDLQDMIKGTK